MSNLQLRVISGIVLAIAVLTLTWSGGLPFRVLAAAIGGLVFYEWATVSGLGRDRPLLWGSAALVLLTLALTLAGLPGATLIAVAAVSVLVVLGIGQVRPLGRLAAAGIAYALFPAIALAFLRGGDLPGLLTILYLFAVVWGTDIFAYFVGRAAGGPKLAPSISPGKTWSGAIGGILAAVAAGALIAYLGGHPHPALLALFAVPLSAVSQIGDLFESAFKRRFGAKDSGSIIPGHGGVMDRVDGLVAAALALYLAGSLLGGPDDPSAGLFPV